MSRARTTARPWSWVGLVAILVATVVPLLSPGVAGAQEPARRSLASYGYGDTSLRGTYASADIFLPLPPGTRATGALMTLDLTASPLLVQPSTMTVQAGGVDVTSVRLGEGGEQHTLVTAIPADRIGATGLAIGLRGYLRLTDEDCEESDNPGQWATLLDSSTVELQLERSSLTIAEIPGLIAGTPDDEPVGIDLGTTSADAATLDAAATAAWQVGRWRAAAGGTALVTSRPDILGDSAPVLAVGRGLGSTSDGPTVAISNETRPRVVVTGTDDDEVLLAARALTARQTVASLQQDSAALTGALPAPLPARSAPWTGSATTFEQLGIARQTVVGQGPREVQLRIDRPPGWSVTEDVTIELDIDASSALRADSSTVQVLVNGIDLGTQPLRARTPVHRVTFVLPAGLADRDIEGRPVRTLDLTIRMVPDLPQGVCDPPDPAASQVSILPTSRITMTGAPAPGAEIGRFPHPLAGVDGDRPVAIVLPDGPVDADVIEAAVQTAAALGRWAGVSGVPPVLVRAADTASLGEDVAGLIVLGTAVDTLAPDAAPPDEAPVIGAPAVTLALSEELVDGRPTLLMVGEGEALVAGARLLADRSVLQQVRGDVVVVQGSLPITLSGVEGATPPVELAPPDRPWFQTADAPYLVPSIIVGLALLALLGTVVAVRWRPLLTRGRATS